MQGRKWAERDWVIEWHILRIKGKMLLIYSQSNVMRQVRLV